LIRAGEAHKVFGSRLGRRRTAAAVGCAVLAVAISGCGGGIPTNASVKDFCKAGQTFAAANEFAAGVKAAKKLHDTGTPKGIPADARSGFELVVQLITDSKDQIGLERRYKGLSEEQKKSVESLDSYITKTC
jgi:hypothetical protein